MRIHAYMKRTIKLQQDSFKFFKENPRCRKPFLRTKNTAVNREVKK